MKSINLFSKILSDSFSQVLKNHSVYLASFFAFIFINLISCIPWEQLGYEKNSFWEILTTIVVGLAGLVVIVNVVLIEKAKIKFTEKEVLLYAIPTYLIYTLYSSVIIILGLFCFIVPGVIAGIFVSLVPLASILIDNDSVNYFKMSYRMVKKDILLVVIYILFTVLVEGVGILLDFISNWQIKLFSRLFYSLIDAFLMIIITVVSVQIFFHLKRSLNDHSA